MMHPRTVLVMMMMMVKTAISEDRVIFPTESNDLSANKLDSRGFFTMDGIPERLLLLMRDINNVTEFLTRFVVVPQEDSGLRPRINSEGDDEPSFLNPNTRGKGGGRGGIALATARRALAAAAASMDIAQFAVCRPETQVVKLQKPETSGVMLWPPCVRLRRCGGCCTSKLLACRPTATSTLNITVLQVRMSPQRMDAFQSEGRRVLTVEQHERCACGCKQLPDQCLPGLQEYRRAECRCVCINHEMALQCVGPDRFWDSADCSCKCRHIVECSTGFYFNFRSCRCEAFRDALLGFRPSVTSEADIARFSTKNRTATTTTTDD